MSCPICILDINEDTTFCCNCKNEYHSTCLSKWMKIKPNCPTCRFEFKKNLNNYEMEALNQLNTEGYDDEGVDMNHVYQTGETVEVSSDCRYWLTGIVINTNQVKVNHYHDLEWEYIRYPRI